MYTKLACTGRVSVDVNVDTKFFLATVTYRDIAISKLHYIAINADHLFTLLRTCVTSHSGLVYYGMSVLVTGYDHVTSGYSAVQYSYHLYDEITF